MTRVLQFGGIEAGGTKFVLGIGTSPLDITEQVKLPTTSPRETLGAAVAWFAARAPLAALGIASFGPLSLDPARADYGCITTTPKPGWSGVDVITPFTRALHCQVALDTDVNAAALAEYRHGAAQGADCMVYLTIGTGIGGGAVINGQTRRKPGHPEMGHMPVQRHPADHDFAGVCPFHGACLEGLASGPAIHARWGQSLSDLPADHPAHDIVAQYLAQAVVALQAILAPARIVMGGGVMATPGLLDRMRSAADRRGAGYFSARASDIVVAPGLGTQSGLIGAMMLHECHASGSVWP